MANYPKRVRACNVVNGEFAPGLFMLEGGRALYDEVYMADGGQAVYLARVESTNEGLKVVRRWIDWDAPIVQMFDPSAPNTASTGQAASGSQSGDNSTAACR